jgi:hypothetical protein
VQGWQNPKGTMLDAKRLLATCSPVLFVHGHCRAVGWSLVWFACTGCGTLRHTYPRTSCTILSNICFISRAVGCAGYCTFEGLPQDSFVGKGCCALTHLPQDIVQKIVVRSVGLLCGCLHRMRHPSTHLPQDIVRDTFEHLLNP